MSKSERYILYNYQNRRSVERKSLFKKHLGLFKVYLDTHLIACIMERESLHVSHCGARGFHSLLVESPIFLGCTNELEQRRMPTPVNC